MGGRVWTLTQTEDTLWYYVYPKPNNQTTGSSLEKGSSAESASDKLLKGRSVKQEEEEVSVQDSTEEELLRDYFQLNIQLEKLYKDWGHRDTHFSQIASIFTGKMSCSISIPTQ